MILLNCYGFQSTRSGPLTTTRSVIATLDIIGPSIIGVGLPRYAKFGGCRHICGTNSGLR